MRVLMTPQKIPGRKSGEIYMNTDRSIGDG
jgi:hypothetical protein